MSRKIFIIAGMLLLVFVAMLAYGVYLGDPMFVFENASGICFT